MKVRAYLIRPSDWNKVLPLVGLFLFEPCECGCTLYSGAGVNLGLFGISLSEG